MLRSAPAPGPAGWETGKRLPLLKGLPRPMTDAERAEMFAQAMRAIAEEPGLSPRLKARGIAPLAAARRRFQPKQS
ncbi:MAG: hypothetical protein BAA04_12325 [Firmicutes bacterium ZCTH02-B6]|nr:MAG: hypothetical protein BAA04_12325 [Firmicutes bacterium ZCTH02-B6]